MKTEDLKNWWSTAGHKELNRILIEFAGLKTGYVPLSNFLSEVCNLSSADEKALVPLLVADGASVRIAKKRSGEDLVYIWLK